MEWRERVAEMEQKVAEAQAESQKVNETVKTRVVTKTQVIRTRGENIVKYVDREVIKYDTKFAPGGQCELPREFVKAINDAAEAPK
jgi:4-hydroxyphenylpyruvate dioxygenase-like putative hemolysin